MDFTLWVNTCEWEKSAFIRVHLWFPFFASDSTAAGASWHYHQLGN
jgi:hypothetical protein